MEIYSCCQRLPNKALEFRDARMRRGVGAMSLWFLFRCGRSGGMEPRGQSTVYGIKGCNDDVDSTKLKVGTKRVGNAFLNSK